MNSHRIFELFVDLLYDWQNAFQLTRHLIRIEFLQSQ